MAGEGDAAALEPGPSARGEQRCAGGGKCAGPASGWRGTGRGPGLFAGRFGVNVARGQEARALASALSENTPGGGVGGGAVGRTGQADALSPGERAPLSTHGFSLLACCGKRERGERLCDFLRLSLPRFPPALSLKVSKICWRKVSAGCLFCEGSLCKLLQKARGQCYIRDRVFLTSA